MKGIKLDMTGWITATGVMTLTLDLTHNKITVLTASQQFPSFLIVQGQ